MLLEPWIQTFTLIGIHMLRILLIMLLPWDILKQGPQQHPILRLS